MLCASKGSPPDARGLSAGPDAAAPAAAEPPLDVTNGAPVRNADDTLDFTVGVHRFSAHIDTLARMDFFKPLQSGRWHPSAMRIDADGPSFRHLLQFARHPRPIPHKVVVGEPYLAQTANFFGFGLFQQELRLHPLRCALATCPSPASRLALALHLQAQGRYPAHGWGLGGEGAHADEMEGPDGALRLALVAEVARHCPGGEAAWRLADALSARGLGAADARFFLQLPGLSLLGVDAITRIAGYFHADPPQRQRVLTAGLSLYPWSSTLLHASAEYVARDRAAREFHRYSPLDGTSRKEENAIALAAVQRSLASAETFDRRLLEAHFLCLSPDAGLPQVTSALERAADLAGPVADHWARLSRCLIAPFGERNDVDLTATPQSWKLSAWRTHLQCFACPDVTMTHLTYICREVEDSRGICELHKLEELDDLVRTMEQFLPRMPPRLQISCLTWLARQYQEIIEWTWEPPGVCRQAAESACRMQILAWQWATVYRDGLEAGEVLQVERDLARIWRRCPEPRGIPPSPRFFDPAWPELPWPQ